MRGGTLGIALLAALAPSLGACGVGDVRQHGSPSPAGRLLLYREEGGLGGARPSLIIFRRARAKLQLGRCSVSFGLRPRAWRRLRTALRAADLPAIAGEYPPPGNSADQIVHVVKAGGYEVSIAPSPLPASEAALARIEPLLGVLGRTVASGERRLPPNCASNRATRRVQGGSA